MPESQVLLSSDELVFGSFRCAAEDPLWRRDNVIDAGHHIVFPRVPVVISGLREREVVATANTLMLYNRGDLYRRTLLDGRGDLCEWLIVSDDLLWSALRDTGAPRSEYPEAPFQYRAGPVDPGCYAVQRLIWRELAREASADALVLEELLLALIPRVLRTAAQAWRPRSVPRRARTRRANREAVVAMQTYIAHHAPEALTLADIAGHAGLSVYHASRMFREHVGVPVYRFVKRLRLALALEWFLEDGRSLADVALAAGFASQSHFTDAFRQECGLSPGALRRRDVRPLLDRIRKNSEEPAFPSS